MTVEELHAELAKQIALGRGWFRVELEGMPGELSELVPVGNGTLFLEAS